MLGLSVLKNCEMAGVHVALGEDSIKVVTTIGLYKIYVNDNNVELYKVANSVNEGEHRDRLRESIVGSFGSIIECLDKIVSDNKTTLMQFYNGDNVSHDSLV